MTIDEIYLSEAVKEARVGARLREEPVGALVVLKGRVVGRAHQQTRALRDPTAHAVMIALTQAVAAAAAGASGSATTRPGSEGGRMRGAALYVTETPCRMCLAAAQHAGVRRITYGVRRKAAAGRRIPMAGGVLKKECASLRGRSPFKSRRAVC